MPRSKELQNLFDELGEEGYKEYRINKRKEDKKQDYINNKEKIKERNKEPEIKEKRQKDNKIWRDDNKEHIKEYRENNKEKRKQNYDKEKVKEYNKEYYKNNTEKKKEQSKNYRDNNKEKVKEYNKEYFKSQRGIKISTLLSWEKQNITFGNTNPSEFYDNIYLPATHCNSCYNEFDKNKNNKKCLDHIHLDIPFNIRGIICNACNMNDAWRYRMRPDSIYNLYVEQYELYIMEKKRIYNFVFD
tara:strand:+ start:214 stop:945 length:732 start_codon:yes stop_codon:yes gene_type:complete